MAAPGVAVHPSLQRLYVSNRDAGFVSVFDTATNAAVAAKHPPRRHALTPSPWCDAQPALCALRWRAATQIGWRSTR